MIHLFFVDLNKEIPESELNNASEKNNNWFWKWKMSLIRITGKQP